MDIEVKPVIYTAEIGFTLRAICKQLDATKVIGK